MPGLGLIITVCFFSFFLHSTLPHSLLPFLSFPPSLPLSYLSFPSLPPPHLLSYSLFHPSSLTHLSHSFSYTPSLLFSHSLTPSLALVLLHSLTTFLTLTHSFSRTRSLTLSHSFSHTHSLLLSHSFSYLSGWVKVSGPTQSGKSSRVLTACHTDFTRSKNKDFVWIDLQGTYARTLQYKFFVGFSIDRLID